MACVLAHKKRVLIVSTAALARGTHMKQRKKCLAVKSSFCLAVKTSLHLAVEMLFYLDVKTFFKSQCATKSVHLIQKGQVPVK